MTFQDLGDLKTLSAPVTGRFRTAPADFRDVSFVWSGDTAGQGWGISAEWGGMKLYEVMRRTEPDFFVHSGDMIYADNPIAAEVRLPSGAVWKNLVIEEKLKVAETLEEFRGNYKYNLMDAHVRRFNAGVAQYVQWDDHEVTNNWFAERVLEDARYTVKSCALLAARAKRAMFEFTPLVGHPLEAERVYRAVRRGPLLDVFMLDMRSYRGAQQREPAGDARRRRPHPGPRAGGLAQAGAPRLTGDVEGDRRRHAAGARRPPRLPAAAGGRKRWPRATGPRAGRELEIADLLRFIKQSGIRNVVWITADVHYCATHLYDPARAQFPDFAPFYEFVSGPLHAGGFGPNALDNTFGPQVVFTRHPGGRVNAPPTEGGLYFGHVRIDGRTGAMTVTHRDLTGAVLHRLELPAEG